MGLTLYGLPLLDDPNDCTKEVWADAHGFSGFYIVSNQGRIASNYKRAEQILRTCTDQRGRHRIRLSHPLKGQCQRSVAKLILLTFTGKPDYMSNPVPAHYNRNLDDLRLFNLTWIDVHFAKISALDADIMRLNFRAGCKISDLAEAYKMTEKHVLSILRQDVWQPPLKTRV